MRSAGDSRASGSQSAAVNHMMSGRSRTGASALPSLLTGCSDKPKRVAGKKN